MTPDSLRDATSISVHLCQQGLSSKVAIQSVVNMDALHEAAV